MPTPKRYWLTPPTIYDRLDRRFHFDFDPCPCPCPPEFNGITVPWGSSTYCNPPFLKRDSLHGAGPTAFVRKAIAEHALGKTVVLLLPVPSYVCLLLEAGAKLSSEGRVRWLEVDSGKPMPSPTPIVCAVLE